jgi:hypothetical protein
MVSSKNERASVCGFFLFQLVNLRLEIQADLECDIMIFTVLGIKVQSKPNDFLYEKNKASDSMFPKCCNPGR